MAARKGIRASGEIGEAAVAAVVDRPARPKSAAEAPEVPSPAEEVAVAGAATAQAVVAESSRGWMEAARRNRACRPARFRPWPAPLGGQR